jgi:hypothetical protein
MIILKCTIKAYDIIMGTAFLWFRTELGVGSLIMVISILVLKKE